MFTEAQLKRIKEIGWAVKGLPGNETKITREDVALLVSRVDDLDAEGLACADEIINWTRDRLAEDLRQKREWLQEALENARTAELLMREAERALAAVQALVDGGMYEHGEEINGRWDAMEALYASQGILPVPEPVAPLPEPVEAAIEPEAQEEVAEAEPLEDFSDLPPALVDQLSEDHPARAPEAAPEPPAKEAPNWSEEEMAKMVAAPIPALTINRIPTAPRPANLGSEQEASVLAALKAAAGDGDQVQIALKQLSDASGVPQGSCLPVLRRLADARRVEIIKAPPKGKVAQPNFYRLIDANHPAGAVAAEEAAEKLAGAWGAKVRVKPTGSVSSSAPLRDRILGILAKSACTTSGLASMLDVKELAICQTLDAMKHEGSVQADEIPEAGRRAQLWREAQQEAAQ